MTIEEVYLRFTQLVNRNATNNNISVDKPRFIFLFNDMQCRFLEWNLEKRNEDSIRYVTHLITKDEKLNIDSKKEYYNSYKLPENYFDFSNLKVFANKGECKKKRLKTFEIKNENLEELWFDKNNEPSFKYRETFYHTTDSNILVYKKGFDIDKTYLTYFRYPRKVDIEGYVNLQGQNTSNVDPEYDDKAINLILLGMSKEFSAIVGDSNQYQMSKDRLFKEM